MDSSLHGKAVVLEASIRIALVAHFDYNRGIWRGDGVVPAGSQNLQNLDANIEAVYLDRNHLNCQQLDLSDMQGCGTLYNLIKQRMNRQ